MHNSETVLDLTLDLLWALDDPRHLPIPPDDADLIAEAVLRVHLLFREIETDRARLGAGCRTLLHHMSASGAPTGSRALLAATLTAELTGPWNDPTLQVRTVPVRVVHRGNSRVLAVSFVPMANAGLVTGATRISGAGLGAPESAAYVRGLAPGSGASSTVLLHEISAVLTSPAQESGERVREAACRELRNRFLAGRLEAVAFYAQQMLQAFDEKRVGHPVWERISGPEVSDGSGPQAEVQVINLAAVEDVPNAPAEEGRPLEEVASDPNTLFTAFVGPGGCGKSFVLSRLFLSRLKRWAGSPEVAPEDRVPVFLVPENEDYASRISAVAEGVFGMHEGQVALRIGALDVTIDALNEVSTAHRGLAPLLDEFPALRFVVASRQQFFLRTALPPGARLFYICPLDDLALDNYLMRCLGAKASREVLSVLEGADNDMRIACRQPLILDGLMHLARTRDELPKSRFDLLNRLIQRIIDQSTTPLMGPQMREGLEILAWRMYDRDQETYQPLTEVSAERATEILEERFGSGDSAVGNVLQSNLLAGGLGGGDTLRFIHHVIMETLAGTYLTMQVERQDAGIVRPYLLWPRYDTVILGLIGLIHQPGHVRELLEVVASTVPKVLAEQASNLDWIEQQTADEMCRLLLRSVANPSDLEARRTEALLALKRFAEHPSRLTAPAIQGCLEVVFDEGLPVTMRVEACTAFSAESAGMLRGPEVRRLVEEGLLGGTEAPQLRAEDLEHGLDQAMARAVGAICQAGVLDTDLETKGLEYFVGKTRQFHSLEAIRRLLGPLLGSGKSPDQESPLVVLGRHGGARICAKLLDGLAGETGFAEEILQLRNIIKAAAVTDLPSTVVQALSLLESTHPRRRKEGLDALLEELAASPPLPPDILARVVPLLRDLDYRIRGSADAVLKAILEIPHLQLDGQSARLRRILTGPPVSSLPRGVTLEGLALAWSGLSEGAGVEQPAPSLESEEDLEFFGLWCYALRKADPYPDALEFTLERLARAGLHRDLTAGEVRLVAELVYFFAYRADPHTDGAGKVTAGQLSKPYSFCYMLWEKLAKLDTIDIPLNYLPLGLMVHQYPIMQLLLSDTDPAAQMLAVRVLAGQCGSTVDDRRNIVERVMSMSYEPIEELYGPLTTLIPMPPTLPSLLRQKSGTEAVHVASLIIMYKLANPAKLNEEQWSDILGGLVDLVHRSPGKGRAKLAPLLVPFMDDAGAQCELEALLPRCPSPLPPGVDNRRFRIYAGALIAESEGWADWAHGLVTAQRPTEQQYEALKSNYANSADPVRSRLYRVGSVWADLHGTERFA